ncbi:MAG: hypothetical protein ACO307_19830 [Ilumatobacteraceae bacterium]
MAHNQDWLEWLSCLNDRHVEYLLVGGMALAHHGVPRYTGDLDVLIRPTTENAERVIQALRDFGFGSLDIGVTDLSSRGRVVQLGFPPGRIDLVTSIDGLSWEEADASGPFEANVLCLDLAPDASGVEGFAAFDDEVAALGLEVTFQVVPWFFAGGDPSDLGVRRDSLERFGAEVIAPLADR